MVLLLQFLFEYAITYVMNRNFWANTIDLASSDLYRYLELTLLHSSALHVFPLPLFYDKCRIKVKVKVKLILEQATKARRCSKGRALISLQPRRHMRVGGQSHAPAALPPGKTWYPLYRRLGGPQGRSGRVRKISPPPPGFDLRNVQPVTSRCTD